jgi:hypothetical protein
MADELRLPDNVAPTRRVETVNIYILIYVASYDENSLLTRE